MVEQMHELPSSVYSRTVFDKQPFRAHEPNRLYPSPAALAYHCPHEPCAAQARPAVSMTPRVIAIGGGGFTHQSDPALEDFMLAQVAAARPRIGFIAAASQDDPQKIARFHQRFDGVCTSHTHLPMTADAAQTHSWLDTLDIVYVGGGNTLQLVAHWRTHGIDRVMVAAAQRGVLMAGVSAGASVWFEHALSDAGGAGLAPTSCIGLLQGSCCPHYSSEPQRRGAFEGCIARGELPGGIAIDDGAAVLLQGGAPRRMAVYAARAGATAQRVWRSEGVALVAPIPAIVTADPP
jgi:dipeptidase E